MSDCCKHRGHVWTDGQVLASEENGGNRTTWLKEAALAGNLLSVVSLNPVKAAVPVLYPLTKFLLGIPFPFHVHPVKHLLPQSPFTHQEAVFQASQQVAVERGEAAEPGVVRALRSQKELHSHGSQSEVRGLMVVAVAAGTWLKCRATELRTRAWGPAHWSLRASRWLRGLCRLGALLWVSATSHAAGM